MRRSDRESIQYTPAVQKKKQEKRNPTKGLTFVAFIICAIAGSIFISILVKLYSYT